MCSKVQCVVYTNILWNWYLLFVRVYKKESSHTHQDLALLQQPCVCLFWSGSIFTVFFRLKRGGIELIEARTSFSKPQTGAGASVARGADKTEDTAARTENGQRIRRSRERQSKDVLHGAPHTTHPKSWILCLWRLITWHNSCKVICVYGAPPRVSSFFSPDNPSVRLDIAH